MAGELIFNEVATPTTPAAGKDAVHANNAPGGASSQPKLARVDSSGNVWFVQEFIGIYVNADFTTTNVLTAQKVFNSSTTGTVTLPASVAYEFNAQYLIFNTGTTSHTFGVNFGGTATLNWGWMYTQAVDFTQQTPPSPVATEQGGWTNTIGTNYTIFTTASTSATQSIMINLRGAFRINAAGTFIPQFTTSAATGVAPVVKAGSFFRASPIGNGTGNFVGNWS